MLEHQPVENAFDMLMRDYLELKRECRIYQGALFEMINVSSAPASFFIQTAGKALSDAKLENERKTIRS